MDQTADYDILLRLFVNLVDMQAGEQPAPGQEWLYDAETLAKKLFEHLVSLRVLCNGHRFAINQHRAFEFVDHGSIKVIARAAFETYLVFFFIYGGSDPALGEFRHAIWRYAGLIDRQKSPATTAESKQVQANEKAVIAQLKPWIEASPQLRAYTEHQAKKILGGDWRGGNPWHSLGTSAGFHENYFRSVYSYLCGYSHASYISAMQVGQARSLDVQRELASMCVGIGAKLMSHFARAYAELFEGARRALALNTEAKQVVDRWVFSAADWQAAVVRRQ